MLLKNSYHTIKLDVNPYTYFWEYTYLIAIISLYYFDNSIDAIDIKKINQLHAVSRIQQGRQSEPNVKTLRSPLSAEFWRHAC